MKILTYNIPLDIASAASSHAFKWKNKRTDWQSIAASLEETTRTEETIAQYFKFSKDRQDEIKDVGGFVGGKLRGGKVFNKRKQAEEEVKPPYGIRRKGHVEHRQIVALDVDYGDLDVWLDFVNLNVAGLFYTTHKHKPNSPRLRVVFPLDRPVSPDEYEAIARVVASWLGIDLFDDTTYQPTRLMYYPSTSKDGEYLFDINDAPIMVADEVLAELDDWTDVTSWPLSSREDAVRPHNGTTVEDPTTKQGVVGAFCRAYTIDEAITEFLPDVYEPCEELGPDRYSYVNGSTAGGLVVYDGLTAYSHHATDPAGGKLSNAFDLVRLHKFGELDEKTKTEDPVKLPSFRAMAEFASGLGPVKKELVAEKRERSASDYDTLEEHARDVATSDDWVQELETEGKKGTIKNCIHNVVLILNNDENLAGRFGFNEFEVREVAVSALPWDKKGGKYPRPLKDEDDAELRLYLERCYGITNKGQIEDGVKIVTHNNSYHPVKNYLNACEWDGTPRLDNLFINLLGAPASPYVRAITRKTFVAAVARIFREGIKYEYVTVIVGPQGLGKSTLIKLMGREWFSDSVTTMVGKEAVESIQGAWLIELGELAGLRKADVDAVKHFVAKCEDRFRVAYGKRQEYFPRRCIFFGTTNEEDFLRDVTGNRRYWVVNCMGGTVKLDLWKYLTPVTVAQIWAEAKHYYKAGEDIFLDKELEEVARGVQDNHLEKDDRSGLISEYLTRLLPKNWESLDPYGRRAWLVDSDNVGTVERRTVCLLEIWAECLGKAPEDIQRKDSIELGRVMKAFRDWKPSGPQRVKYYGLQKQYVTDVMRNPDAEDDNTKKRPRPAGRRVTKR